MGERLIETVNATTIAALLKQMGWPASPAGGKDAPRIVSTVNGVNFNICFGTKAPGKAGWTDFTLSAPFSIDQQISPVVSAFWNRRNRFARVYRTDTHIFLDMDVVVHSGVSEAHMKHQLAVWSDISHMFLRHLRADQAVLARYNAAQGEAAGRPVGANGRAVAPGAGASQRAPTPKRTEQPAGPDEARPGKAASKHNAGST